MIARIDKSRLSPSNSGIALIAALIDIPKEQLGNVKDSLIGLLRHPDTDVRVHAFRRLFVHLRDGSAREVALEALRDDREVKVRRVAAHAISATSSANTRRIDRELLLESLLDKSEDVSVRGAAYEALLLLHGRTDFPPISREIRLEEDVDWDWIRLLRSSDE